MAIRGIPVHNHFVLFLFLTPIIITTLPFRGAFCMENDTIILGSFIKDPDSIVSPGNTFKLGFFSPINSTNRYLGIFYYVSQENIIWIANRDKPLKDSSGKLTISRDGNLELMKGRNGVVWSSDVKLSPSAKTRARILDSGNLVLQDVLTGQVVWESFMHPSNVFVPTMNITDDTSTGNKVFLSSWKSSSNPGVGNFTLELDALDVPQLYIRNQGRLFWRTGPSNGQVFIGVKDMLRMSSPYLDGLVNNSSTTYYFTAPRGRFFMKFDLNASGILVQSLWSDQTKKWDVTWFAPQDECELYGRCGPFGSCNIRNSPICSCLQGFEPRNEEQWRRGNWSEGCVRRKPLQCVRGGNGDGFLRLRFMKVPDFAERVPSADQVDECKGVCLRNCSCIAYAYESRIGCMMWRESLIDVEDFSGVGPDLYIRLAGSELGQHNGGRLLMIIIISVIGGSLCISFCIFVCWRRMNHIEGDCSNNRNQSEIALKYASDSTAIVLRNDSKKEIGIEDFPLFSFKAIANATNQFHEDNLIGRGGFGYVYKGKLPSGKEIAVKRLSAASGQGAEEFMNEMTVIFKIQHRNLVRLLGCCVERKEKMLIYEYMPNKSLNMFLFDPTHPSQNILDWKRRFSIIEGIGRGLMYLHKDSRLKIIHRDLKPSNVLLDEDWNPKISDFGMARIFGCDQDHANTARVMGTYGYMAPEYAMEGRFSEKSDVYSFGVLMLEILSGKKNTCYYNHELSLSLLGCAWKFWSEDNCSSFLDPMLITSSNLEEEMVRCVHIALLCVQEFAKDRPCISTVLSMLSREIEDLPVPAQPAFPQMWGHFDDGSAQPNESINQLTITALDGR